MSWFSLFTIPKPNTFNLPKECLPTNVRRVKVKKRIVVRKKKKQ